MNKTTISPNENIPWIEKYRPTSFENIVLDKNNKTIFKNITDTQKIPNLLLFGPPGTGKTTTAINFIKSYQRKSNIQTNELIMHLNASDERGIDVIRNQINQFVNSKWLFTKGTKFVILDEVDYMTKSAQQALKYLISSLSNNVCFILICNYICKIDNVLQNIFIRLRFNNLPLIEIEKYINNVAKKEQLNIDQEQISNIITYFKSDIRSMINYLQSNHDNININTDILTDKFIEKMIEKLKKTKRNKENIVCKVCKKHNIQKREFLTQFISYLIFKRADIISTEILTRLQFIIHNNSVKEDYLVQYLLGELDSLYNVL